MALGSTVYVDLTAGSDAADGSNDANAIKTLAPLTGNQSVVDTVLVKRGTRGLMTDTYIQDYDGLLMQPYGSTSDPGPIFDGYFSIGSTGDWSEVDPADPTQADTGSNFWVYQEGTSDAIPRWVSFGTPDAAGIGSRIQHYKSTDKPTLTVKNSFTQDKDWDSVEGGTTLTTSAIFVYSVGNPFTNYGTVYWGSNLESPIYLQNCSNVEIYGMQGGNCDNFIFLVTSGAGVISTNIRVSQCNGLNCGQLIAVLPKDGGIADGYLLDRNTGSNFHRSFISIVRKTQNTIIELNEATTIGTAESPAGIHTFDVTPASGSENHIRRNKLTDMRFGRYWEFDGGSLYTDGNSSNNLVYQNTVKDSHMGYAETSTGDTGNSNYAYSNVFDNCDVGASIRGYSLNHFFNNTIVNSGLSPNTDAGNDGSDSACIRVVIGNVIEDGVKQNSIKSNVLHIADDANTPYGMIINNLFPDVDHDYNCFYGASENIVSPALEVKTIGANSFESDPQIRSGTYDPGSALRNTGANKPISAEDYNGYTWVHNDIGAVQVYRNVSIKTCNEYQ